MNKQVAIIAAFIAAFAVIFTSAYDYNDPVFNRILANDLLELAELDDNHDYYHPRNRRDEEAVVNNNSNQPDKCKRKMKKLCCAEETFEEHHEQGKELKRECYKAVTGKDKDSRDREFDPFKCDKVEKHRKEMTCIMQCVGQKKDLLDKEGNPKEAEFAAFVKDTMAKESWFATIQDKVIPTCLNEARNATANRDTSDAESCNPAGVKLVHCLFREIQLGCPAEEIKDQKACSRARDKIKRHNDFFPAQSAFMNDE